MGVGSGDGNSVNRMIQTRIEGVAVWAINMDAQALAKSLAPNVLTRGLGAGGDLAVGEKMAMENTKELERICEGADMTFITAGMGGGAGSGAAPVVAEIAKTDCGCLTVGVVTKPFAFKGGKRMKQAKLAIELFVSTLISSLLLAILSYCASYQITLPLSTPSWLLIISRDRVLLVFLKLF